MQAAYVMCCTSKNTNADINHVQNVSLAYYVSAAHVQCSKACLADAVPLHQTQPDLMLHEKNRASPNSKQSCVSHVFNQSVTA